MRYRDVHELSIENRRFFWRQKMDLIHWFESPADVLGQDENGLYRWYAGGKLNTCHLALDYQGSRGGREQPLPVAPAAKPGTRVT